MATLRYSIQSEPSARQRALRQRGKQDDFAGVEMRGRAIRCHITCTPFLGADGRGDTQREGVVLVMEEAET